MNIKPLASTCGVDELSVLLSAACARVLSQAEVEALCGLAAQLGRSEPVVVELLSARSAPSRLNLLAAWPRLRSWTARRGREAQRQADRSPGRVPPAQGALPFTLTHHAIERFVERYGPFPSHESARVSLETEASAATPIRERTIVGQEQWRGPSGVLFVVKRDGRGAPPVCVTVLPRRSRRIAISELETEPDRDQDEGTPDSHERLSFGSDGRRGPCSSDARRCAR